RPGRGRCSPGGRRRGRGALPRGPAAQRRRPAGPGRDGARAGGAGPPCRGCGPADRAAVPAPPRRAGSGRGQAYAARQGWCGVTENPLEVRPRPLQSAVFDRVLELERELFGAGAWTYGMLADELAGLGRWYVVGEPADAAERYGVGRRPVL